MTNHTSTVFGGTLQEEAGADLSLPTLANLDPIANFIAMRFALAGVSSTKVHQVLEILHYHCLQTEGHPPRPAFDICKLNGWLDKSSGDFKDDESFEVLQAVLNWYDQTARERDRPKSRLQIKRSLSDFVAVMRWKYESFEVGRHPDQHRHWRRLKRPVVLGLKPGNQETKIYRWRYRHYTNYTTIQLSAESAQSLQQCYQTLQPVNTAIVQMRNLDQAADIRKQLDDAIEDLDIGWRARLTVGIMMVEPL